MQTYIAFLRAINVSGQNPIKMDALKETCQGMGLINPRTYLQSGNIVFESNETNIGSLTNLISKQLASAFGYLIPVLVLSREELIRVQLNNPFAKIKQVDPTFFHVTFFANPIDSAVLADIPVPNAAGDSFVMGLQEVYIYAPGGYGNTKFNNSFFEKKLKTPATTRNWNTINAVIKLAN